MEALGGEKPSVSQGTRYGVQCVVCTLVLLFIAGVIIFPIGYNTAYIQYPLPAYGTWRNNQAVVEDTKFGSSAIPATASTPAVAAGDCAVKLWFVIYHTASGALERPKRIAAWTTVALPAPATALKCKNLQTKNVHIFYDTKNPTNVRSQRRFDDMKKQFESNHKYGSHLFWLGTTFLSCVLIPLVLWLAALVFEGLRHITKTGVSGKPQYDKVTNYAED